MQRSDFFSLDTDFDTQTRCIYGHSVLITLKICMVLLPHCGKLVLLVAKSLLICNVSFIYRLYQAC